MASMNEKDYYAILGVSKDATTEEIRRAFQQKARKLHPDVNKEPDAEERFKEVSEAYAVLSDEQKRRRYDAMRSGSPFAPSGYGGSAYGAPSPRGGAGDAPFGWGFPFGGSYSRRSATRSRAYNPRAGADVTVEVELDDEAVREGLHRGITYQRYVSCDACHGRGSVRSEHPETCPTCGGTGHISVDLSGIFAFGVMEMQCPECEGVGKVVADPCSSCGGSGRVLSASEVVVDIPAGAHDGDEIRVKGMGNAGTNGSAAGDFVCKVGVASERVNQVQAFGFQTIGFALPFLILGLWSGVVGSMLPFVVVLVVLGVFSIARGGGLGHGSRWWQNVMASLFNGILYGLLLSALILSMYSCGSVAGGYGRGF